MLIALDFDGTYLEDPELFNFFINIANLSDHEVIIVTARYEGVPEESNPVRYIIGDKCKIYFTGRKAKEKYLLNLGIKPDIWIDDHPLYIYYDWAV